MFATKPDVSIFQFSLIWHAGDS